MSLSPFWDARAYECRRYARWLCLELQRYLLEKQRVPELMDDILAAEHAACQIDGVVN